MIKNIIFIFIYIIYVVFIMAASVHDKEQMVSDGSV